MGRIILVVACMMAVGCASTYKPAHTGGTIGGYDDAKISDGKYRVTWQGQGKDSPAAVYKWFLLRAADLTKQNGFSYFKIENGQDGMLTRGTRSATASIPNYSGTVVMLKAEEPGSLSAEEILKDMPAK